ncbi:hypothetical protein AB0L41_24140 [Amycolatopsis mediterranei]|uniref:hypothetical protein n=1 Tax=Amycolatopsis mediterranei TaxID=33910 RepID=UPI003443B0C2
MFGISITYSYDGVVPPSPEVLGQEVLRVADRVELAVEHHWVSTGAGRCHVVLFLRGAQVAEAAAACLAFAGAFGSSNFGFRFLGCTPISP